MTLKLDKDMLFQKTIKEKKSLAQVSTEVGICKSTLIRYLKKYELYDQVKRLHKFQNRKTKNLIGKRFTKLLVVDYTESDRHGKTNWMCKCDCGQTRKIAAASLLRGLTKTCGYCSQHNFKGHEDISGTYFHNLKKSAIKRDLEFNITIEYIWEIYLNQNKKCSLSNCDIIFYRNQDKPSLQTASVDRVDNKIGYTEGNIQIVHKRINRIKTVLSNEELIFWSSLIYKNNKNQIENFNTKEITW